MPVRRKNPEPVADETVLPPGQRDRSGFWFPAGYDDPRTLVRRRLRRPRAAKLHPEGGQDQAPSS